MSLEELLIQQAKNLSDYCGEHTMCEGCIFNVETEHWSACKLNRDDPWYWHFDDEGGKHAGDE
jgi:hypothetical protein